MLWCNPCAMSNTWPVAVKRVYGECDCCGQQDVCNDSPDAQRWHVTIWDSFTLESSVHDIVIAPVDEHRSSPAYDIILTNRIHEAVCEQTGENHSDYVCMRVCAQIDAKSTGNDIVTAVYRCDALGIISVYGARRVHHGHSKPLTA